MLLRKKIPVDHTQTKIAPNEETCIIGDGPIALLIAVLLKLRGVKDVTVVGPRLNEFTRSGDYVEEVFTTLKDLLAESLGFDLTPGRHIKDVERQLYAICQRLGVHFIKKSFEAFDQTTETLILSDPTNHSISTIKAKVVFECTGKKRKVIEALNKLNPDHFKSQSPEISGQLHRSYALVRALIPDEHFDAIEQFSNDFMFGSLKKIIEENPHTYALMMEKLKKLNWKSDVMPEFYGTSYGKTGSIRKVNFYIETAENLDNDKVIEFLKILIKFALLDNSDKDYPLQLHKPSKNYPSKQVISQFEIEPKQTSPGYYRDKNLMLLVLGDALFDVPFIEGKGLLLGIHFVKAMFQTIIIGNGHVVGFDAKKYDEIYDHWIKKHSENLNQLAEENEGIRDEINNPLFLHHIYKDALKKNLSSEQRVAIQKGLSELQPRLGYSNETSNAQTLSPIHIRNNTNTFFSCKKLMTVVLVSTAAVALTQLKNYET